MLQLLTAKSLENPDLADASTGDSPGGPEAGEGKAAARPLSAYCTALGPLLERLADRRAAALRRLGEEQERQRFVRPARPCIQAHAKLK